MVSTFIASMQGTRSQVFRMLDWGMCLHRMNVQFTVNVSLSGILLRPARVLHNCVTMTIKARSPSLHCVMAHHPSSMGVNITLPRVVGQWPTSHF